MMKTSKLICILLQNNVNPVITNMFKKLFHYVHLRLVCDSVTIY